MNSLTKYRNLIAEMPVMEQAFTTKRTTWNGKVDEPVLDRLFDGKVARTISRNDLFSKCPIEDFVYLVIFWGYPRGMRGSLNDKNIFSKIEEIISIVNIPERGKFAEGNLQAILKKLSDITGLGISTISKLLYFRTHKYGDYDALILDERLMRIFNNKIFEEFSELGNFRYDNACSKYLDYLKTMRQTALQLNVSPAKLEMFLFIFGNNMKS